MTKLYVDMDGVLANFDRHYEDMFGVKPDKIKDNVDWQLVRESKNFYRDIPPMGDMALLWSYVEKYRPTVLTGIPKSVAEAASNKVSWVLRNLGPDVPVICCLSRDKCVYSRPDALLIDDWDKYRAQWVDRGGRWITHTNAFNTIEQLQALGL